MNSENIFLEIVKDLLIYSKSDILILAKKYNIPFINKSQAVYVIAYKIFSENFSNVGRMRSVHGDSSSSRDEDNDEEKYPREEVKEAPSTDVVNPIGDDLEDLVGRNPGRYILSKYFEKDSQEFLNAVKNNNLDLVKYYSSIGLVNTVDKDGKTALMTAAEWGHADVVEFLLEKSADINAVNEFGNTSLIIAANHEQTTIVELLLDSGADIYITNDIGDSVFDGVFSDEINDLLDQYRYIDI